MNDTPTKSAGPISYLGCGCGVFGGLMLLLGLATIGAILAGAFNYSVEPQAWAGGGTGACLGIGALIVGVGLYMVGKTPVSDED